MKGERASTMQAAPAAASPAEQNGTEKQPTLLCHTRYGAAACVQYASGQGISTDKIQWTSRHGLGVLSREICQESKMKIAKLEETLPQ